MGVTEMQQADRDGLKDRLAALAQQGVFVGTSSWKYPGWQGTIYNRDRYVWRGRYSTARFERLCLAEYAEVFKTVSVDASYYTFPKKRNLDEMAAMVPGNFRFAFKVTDQITLKRYPNLARFGRRAGQLNPDFLRADRFASQFLEPCQSLRGQLGILMFEFSRFSETDFDEGTSFARRLDQFLGELPSGWPYGVEIRNASFLCPEYFEVLDRHSVSHIYNSWQGMLPIGEQLALSGNCGVTQPIAARFLLRPGRAYADAVKRFSPYERLREPYPDGTVAGARLIREGLKSGGEKAAFIYVNNRFEGNAPSSILRMLNEADGG